MPPPPPSRFAEDVETPPITDPAASPTAGDAGPTDAATASETTAPPACGWSEPPSTPSRRRLSWAQMLRRVLYVDALACPGCSTPTQTVPMVVLAFLSDPEVVGRILKHLGLSLPGTRSY